MPTSLFRRPGRLLAALLTALCGSSVASAELQSIGTYYRPDQDFPQYREFWHQDAAAPDEADLANQADDGEEKAAPAKTAKKSRTAVTASQPASADQLGASLHVFVRNNGEQTVTLKDVLLDGMSLNDALAFSNQRKTKKFASIYYASISESQRQKLIDSGEPVWWKVDPPEIPSNATAEVIVRLRQQPKADSVTVSLKSARPTLDATVSVRDSAPRVAGINFAANLRDLYMYFRHPDGHGKAPAKLLLDGEDITQHCKIFRDDSIALTPVTANLSRPLTAGSFHVFSAAYEDGSSATAGIRAWSDEFAYGMFGGKPGKESQPEIGLQYVNDLLAHHLNIQMPQIGSGACQAFFRSKEGKQYMTDNGFRFILQEPEKLGITNPYALYVHDEPDCGDYKAEGLAENKKIGVLARWVISRADEFRKAAPAVQQMLNINMTYRPHCWHTYGQIPDILAVDPYYQVRLRDAYWKSPERIPLYKKATYISMVGDIAESACEPRPLHVILYGNRYVDKQNKSKVFRYPTPAEKRIEAYYALGAGAKGLSYWWYTPAAPAYGLGGATANPADTEATSLWREVGLIGAEARTAGPVIMKSCPIDVTAETSDDVLVRFLAAGSDTLLMLAVNNNYENTDKGTKIETVKSAEVTLKLPSWMKTAQAFEITAGSIKTCSAGTTAEGFRVPLGLLPVTRMIVITSDGKLRSQLQSYYASHLAATAKNLLKASD
jgi:hypothetical protein